MREQGEPASAITVEYRPHGQSRSDSPPGIATGFKCLTPIQREGWTPSGSPQVLISGQLYKKLPEDLRRQGEPASATRNTGHTDNPNRIRPLGLPYNSAHRARDIIWFASDLDGRRTI